jgi:multicomponent K+:H+ antiporter subunit A
MLLTLVVLLPFVGSVCAAFLPAHARNAAAALAGIVATACVGLIATQYAAVQDGTVLRATLDWMPRYGLDFYLRMDGFAWLFHVLDLRGEQQWVDWIKSPYERPLRRIFE